MCHIVEHLKILFGYQKGQTALLEFKNDAEQHKDHKTHKLE